MSITVAQLKSYIQEDLNILVVGPAGTGKTAMLKEACNELGLKMKYYNAATLDPFADLLGIPVPKPEEKRVEYYRPRDVDDAEVIFVDELNRANTQTTNAIFEMIQFRTINGDPLPKLRCVVAAINPVEAGYDTNELDIALVDRFDVYLNAPPEVCVKYFRDKFGDDYAKAGIQIFNEYQRDYNSPDRSADNKLGYFSPRRLDKLMEVFKKFPRAQTVSVALPNDVIVNAQLVTEQFLIALGIETPTEHTDVTQAMGAAAQAQINMPLGRLRTSQNAPEFIRVYEWAKENDAPVADQMLVQAARALANYVSPSTIGRVWGSVVSDFNPSQVNIMTAGMSEDKRAEVNRVLYAMGKPTV